MSLCRAPESNFRGDTTPLLGAGRGESWGLEGGPTLLHICYYKNVFATLLLMTLPIALAIWLPLMWTFILLFMLEDL